MPKNETAILRPRDLALVLGVSRSTIWRWRQQNVLPAPLGLGQRVIGWKKCEIDQWLDNLGEKK